jgi:hypothetical protein
MLADRKYGLFAEASWFRNDGDGGDDGSDGSLGGADD